jgi:hypothetical protein
MQPQLKPYLSPEAYLRLERQAETRSEYLDGEVYAMAGASEAHHLIAANLIISLGGQVKGRPCKVYRSDMRVKVRATGLYTYPDVAVVCGSPPLRGQTEGHAARSDGHHRSPVTLHRALRSGRQVRPLQQPGIPQRLPARRTRRSEDRPLRAPAGGQMAVRPVSIYG